MNLVRAVLGDLVEKRLWPIALLLAMTAVAVPVVLGRGGTGAADAPVATQPAAAAGGAASSTPAVEIVGPASARRRSGRERDPFRRATTAPAATATVDGAPAQSQAASKAASAPKHAAADASAAATTTTTKPAAAAPAAPAAAGAQARSAATVASVYRARVRWGHDDDDKARVRGVARLQPLGGRSNPALLYLGTTKRHRAIFLLGPSASASGESTCAEKTCRVIKLKAGARTVVNVEDGDGGEARRYTLVVDGIVRQPVASRAAAAKLRTRVYDGGRDVLRDVIKDEQTAAAIGRFGFDRSLGAVVATNAP